MPIILNQIISKTTVVTDIYVQPDEFLTDINLEKLWYSTLSHTRLLCDFGASCSPPAHPTSGLLWGKSRGSFVFYSVYLLAQSLWTLSGLQRLK